jgi:hypothetical protein
MNRRCRDSVDDGSNCSSTAVIEDLPLGQDVAGVERVAVGYIPLDLYGRGYSHGQPCGLDTADRPAIPKSFGLEAATHVLIKNQGNPTHLRFYAEAVISG